MGFVMLILLPNTGDEVIYKATGSRKWKNKQIEKKRQLVTSKWEGGEDK